MAPSYHGYLREAGDITIWIHRVMTEQGLASPASLQAASSGLVVQVDDVDAHYEQVRAYGAHIEHEPQQKSHPWAVGGFTFAGLLDLGSLCVGCLISPPRHTAENQSRRPVTLAPPRWA
jgi:hypothetical protein